MTIPTREIPKATQDELRALIDAHVWARLSEEIRDHVIRSLNGLRSSRGHLDEYVALFNPLDTTGASRFGYLTLDEQRAVLDVALLRPGLGDVLTLRFIVDAVGASSWSSAVRAAIFEYVTWPTHPPASLPEPDRRRLTRWRLEQHGLRLATLAQVLRNGVFAHRPSSEQLQIVTILHRARAIGADVFIDLLTPASTRWTPGTVPPGTMPLFSESLLERITLLEALHRVATGRLLPDVGRDPPKSDHFLTEAPFAPDEMRALTLSYVLTGLIGEAARPDQYFNQSDRSTCFSTSLLHRLARVRPAEYVRIAHELVTTGRSQLQNRDLVVSRSDSHADDHSMRSVSERMTQAMLSEYWIAGELRAAEQGPHYHNTTPTRHVDHSNPTGAAVDRFDGNFSNWTERLALVAEALLGQRFRRVTGGAVGHLRTHFAAQPDVPIFAGVNFGRAHEVDVLSIDPPNVPDPRVRYWNPWGALLFAVSHSCPIRVEGGTVERQGVEVHSSRRGPARRTEDDSRAIQSMTVQQFSINFYDLLLPM